MSFALDLGVVAAAAGLVAMTIRAYVAGAARPPWHRFLSALAGVLCAAGAALLVAGARSAGSAALGLAVEAFFCSIVFVGPPLPGDDDDHGGGGGPGGPGPGDGPDSGDPVDWERFERDLASHVRARDPALR